HAVARRLPAEVLYDAIHRATGAVSKLPGLPPGARAAQLVDSNVEVPSGFLDLFGKPARESACECERSAGMNLGPVLNLVNGPIVADAVKDPANRIAALAAKTPDDAKFIEEIYLATLSRRPTPAEVKLGVEALNAGRADHVAAQEAYRKRVADFAAYDAK